MKGETVMMLRMLLLVASVALCGCSTTSTVASSAAEASRPSPLKVAVYADNGPSGIGAVEWFRLVDESPDMELHLVDGKAVRAGALEGLDLLVMPGGNSKTEFTTLGTNGVERIKAFLRAGGGYIGTCAGCCLLMDGEDRRARIMPWNTCGSEPDTLFPTFQLNAKGAAALGLKKGPHKMRYHGGPCMWPTTNVIADAKFEVWGTFDAEAAMKGKVKLKMHGAAAILGGTYGKGKVFVTSAHPEYFNSTLYVVKGAFRYVTGRDVTFPLRARKPRAITVGFVSGGIRGVDTAQTALDIAADKDLDLVLIDVDGIRQRRLDHLDVLVLTNEKLAEKDFAAERKIIDEFVARGGKVVGFKGGRKLLPAGGIACGTGKDTVNTIRSLFSL